MKALGMIEVSGYVAGVAAADAALKAASVTLIALEKVNAGITNVQITGDIGAVKAAVDSGASTAEELGMLRSSHVIARLHEETLKLFPKFNVEINKSINRALVEKSSKTDVIKLENKNNKEETKNIEKEVNSIIEETKALDNITQEIIKEAQNLEDKTLEIIKENEEVKGVIEDIIEESKSLEDENEKNENNKNQKNNEISIDKQTNLIDYSSMRVDELRKLVRSLNLPHLTNKQIKFEKKDVLIKILLEYGRIGEK